VSEQEKVCGLCGGTDFHEAWSLYGTIDVGFSGCASGTLVPDGMWQEASRIMNEHQAVILNGAQQVKIAWGPGTRTTESEPNRPEVLRREFLLCHDCQEAFLKLVGAFFFSKEARQKAAEVVAKRELREATKRYKEAEQRLAALTTIKT